jgi:hypothetical protein
VAERFSDQFYKTVIEKPGDYQGAFDQGRLAAENLQNAKRHNGARKPDGTPCFFSMADNILPDQRTEKSKEEEVRIRRKDGMSKTEKETAVVKCKVQGEEIGAAKEEGVAATLGYCSNEEPVVLTQTSEPAFLSAAARASIKLRPHQWTLEASEADGVVVVESPQNSLLSRQLLQEYGLEEEADVLTNNGIRTKCDLRFVSRCNSRRDCGRRSSCPELREQLGESL